ncbi:isochorismatase family protein [Microbacterium sp. 1.5R]|uniref:isochorismatase family protein n=1 Tax=Microbacterium sp. 1.5R TaxID=1916917 RepID=UPI0011A88DE0|nr:isochorismatase family protein [Microbacterium sp. 1.5R]
MSDDADYDRAGLAGALVPGASPALIIVDPCEAYTNPACPLYAGVEAEVENMRTVRAAAVAAGIPVIITRVHHDDTGRDGGVFVRKVPALKWFRDDSPFHGYIEGLAPGEGDIEIVKQYPSAFAGTSLVATLASLRVDTLVIVGLSTSGCIRATATDCMQSGFIPIVVRDAVGDRLPGPHEANLFDIQAKIGEVVSLDESIALLSGAA